MIAPRNNFLKKYISVFYVNESTVKLNCYWPNKHLNSIWWQVHAKTYIIFIDSHSLFYIWIPMKCLLYSSLSIQYQISHYTKTTWPLCFHCYCRYKLQNVTYLQLVSGYFHNLTLVTELPIILYITSYLVYLSDCSIM